MSRLRALSVALVVVLLAGAGSLAAQETISSASVGGRVLDESSAAIPGAAVVMRHVETNLTSTATSAADGRFRFPYLRIGQWEIKVSKAGFAVVTRTLTLNAGAAFELPITLRIENVQTEVTVTAEVPTIEAARSQIATTVSMPEIKALPLNGRNFLDIALLVPGVSPTNVGGGTQLFAETSAVPGTGLSVGSQRNFSNNFIVDGLSANDDAAGLSGMPYGVDAIEQVQVVTSGGQAELGRALGGYVNLVTRSGTNLFGGDLYAYGRNDRWNAANALTGTKLPMSQAQYGGSGGGPLRRDRTFFFTNVEQRRLDQSGLVTILPENVAAINAQLASAGYGGPPVTTGVYANPVDTTNVLAKLDHQLGLTSHLGVRFSLYDVHSDNSRGVGALTAPSASAGLDNLDRTFSANHIVAWSPRMVMETRAQVTTSNLLAPPTDSIGPAVTILGVATFGTLSVSPTRRANTLAELVSSVSYQSGAHAIRTGVDVLYNDLTITFPRSARGAYTFSSLANFLAGTYNNNGFTQTFGVTETSQSNPNVGIYVQDEWKAGARVTVNAGLRYDLQYLETIATDTNNISPRVGVAWLPFRSRGTVVRGSAGVFYDRVPLRALANALLSAGNTTDVTNLKQVNVSLAPAQTGAPIFPNILNSAVPLTTLVNLTTMDRQLENAYSRQASVEIEHQVGARTTVSVGVEHLAGDHLVVQVNQNVPTCAASGNNNGCRPNAGYANNNQYSAVGSSSYNALHVSFVQRPTSWGSYRVSYAFSKSMNDVGEAFFNAPIDPADISKDWGRSDDDQRHRLVVSGAVSSHGFQLSGLLQFYSALPFNITSGVTTLQGTAGRPIVNGAFIPRNAGEGSDFFTTSLRLARTFKVRRMQIEGLVEAFNVFNRRNDLTRNANFGPGAYPDAPSSTFGQVTSVGDPRTLQLGIRVKF